MKIDVISFMCIGALAIYGLFAIASDLVMARDEKAEKPVPSMSEMIPPCRVYPELKQCQK